MKENVHLQGRIPTDTILINYVIKVNIIATIY